jgi:hypothetical protein
MKFPGIGLDTCPGRLLNRYQEQGDSLTGFLFCWQMIAIRRSLGYTTHWQVFHKACKSKLAANTNASCG